MRDGTCISESFIRDDRSNRRGSRSAARFIKHMSPALSIDSGPMRKKVRNAPRRSPISFLSAVKHVSISIDQRALLARNHLKLLLRDAVRDRSYAFRCSEHD